MAGAATGIDLQSNSDASDVEGRHRYAGPFWVEDWVNLKPQTSCQFLDNTLFLSFS